MRNLILAATITLLTATVAGSGEMHPGFPLLDKHGAPVETSGQQVSAKATCGECHDTDFINTHNSHSGDGIEVDCFGCHLPDGKHSFEQDYFTVAGKLNEAISTPTSEICGQCHGYASVSSGPVEIDKEYLLGDQRGKFGSTLRTGQIFSGQQVADSYLNLPGKSSLSLPWDVHAARQLECTSCHFAGNNPGKTPQLPGQEVPHLLHDPRCVSIEQFLKQPDHRLVTIGCTGCHDAAISHSDLPYVERHLAALACQACHVSRQMGPALQSIDRTVVTGNGTPHLEIRGVARQEWSSPGTWYNQGYLPFLLLEQEESGSRFAPYNLVTSWQWVAGEDSLPLAENLVRQAWLDTSGGYHSDLIPHFDSDHSGDLEPAELRLDSETKTGLIREKLTRLGAQNPRITARIDAFPLRHGIVSGQYSSSECASCHEASSRFNEQILLATGPFPGGVKPVADRALIEMLGAREILTEAGELRVTGNLEAGNHYIFGHSSRPWIDLLGLGFLLLTVAGVSLHGGARIFITHRRGPVPAAAPMKRVYMYGQYERVWHWVMALSIILLLLTGFQVHFPTHFTLIKFATAILLHNIMAAVLIINSILALFFHLATAEIKQFIPERAGLLKRVLIQGRYYLQGIFQGTAHPIHKTPEHKLNPLQQITYAGLLNFLFPLQIITGILLWIGGLMPVILTPIGGLVVLGPLHNLGSWLFLSFLVIHVYLTTTGHTVTSNIQAMTSGWEYIESETEVKI